MFEVNKFFCFNKINKNKKIKQSIKFAYVIKKIEIKNNKFMLYINLT